MAASSQATLTLFQNAVSQILDSWTVLKLAVDHGFGGSESKEKAEWMIFAIDQWFTENKNLDPSEVEDFLADVLNAEFDTIADDGSLSQIASMICGVYRLCSDGNETAVNERLQKLPKPATKQCARAPSDDDGDSGDEEMEASPSHNNSSSQGASSSSTASQSSESLQNGTENDEEMEDDGWTVIRRGKKK